MNLTYTARRAARLSAVLKEDMGISTGLMNRLKWQDKLFVNGSPRHTDYPVQPGDVVSVLLDEPAPEYPAEAGSLTVLYEDAYILAVDKPTGMLIHPSRATMTGTLANRVLFHYQTTGQQCAFHPLTRLDRDTFGVVLLAKNSHVHALLSEKTDIKKTYHGLVYGVPQRTEGVIDAPIARRPLPSLLRYVNQEGKPSVTKYRVLGSENGVSRLALTPVTGRTHQLRVHCAYMGFPIVGDPQYGSDASKAYSSDRGFRTQQLCAKRLEFIHPITGEEVRIESQFEIENCGRVPADKLAPTYL